MFISFDLLHTASHLRIFWDSFSKGNVMIPAENVSLLFWLWAQHLGLFMQIKWFCTLFSYKHNDDSKCLYSWDFTSCLCILLPGSKILVQMVHLVCWKSFYLLLLVECDGKYIYPCLPSVELLQCLYVWDYWQN